ncbi:HvfC/BufC N-terminal domain-containing protein [Desertibaculum subflavum]|uniref:HvfC/BufC N-terminal domain-containing protein n=1 Tax=Desertibaculum subflavum TaxID=2268458 RepID=UPI0013C4E143
MNPSLRELQAGMARAILAGDPAAAPAIAAWIVADGIDPSRRLGIHANHYRLSLVEALGTTFAPVRRLVGEAYFDALAGRFAAAQPPAGPCLFEYGGDFADFCAGDAAAAATPFLPDMLRFAFALNRAMQAEPAPVLDVPTLAAIDPRQLPDLRSAPVPGVTLIASRFPLTALWRLATDASDDPAPVDLDAGGERIAIWPDGDRPAWITLEPGDHAFLAAMAAGETLGAAAAAAAAADPMFHLAGALGLALRHGLLGPSQVLPSNLEGTT